MNSLYFVAGLLVSAPSSAATAETPHALSSSQACLSAKKKADYGIFEPRLDAGLRKSIAVYRAGWMQHCATPGSLADLFEQAESLTSQIAQIPDEKEDIRDFISKIDFFPAIQCSLNSEFSACYIRDQAFEEAAILPEDHLFLTVFGWRSDGLRPWIDLVTDVTGCTLFGGYPWAEHLARLDAALVKIQHAVYRRHIERTREEIVGTFTQTVNVCSCDADRPAIFRDFEAVLTYARSHEADAFWKQSRQAIETTLAQLKANPKPVRNNSKNRCSG